MFRYSLFLDTLFKAMGHKYIRRVPKGVTKTGATKYMYFYAGQEGHGKGIGHESELVTGASFAFGEHGKTRYHAHITKVDGDKVTVKYDDGDKKGTEETMTKKQFQALVHGEHSTSIQSAKEKATKQLKDFQAGKEKGVKVKQETLDKLEQRVKTLDALTAKKEDAQKPEAPIKMIKDYFANAFSSKVTSFNEIVKEFVKFNENTSENEYPYKTPKFTSEMLDGVIPHTRFNALFDRYVIRAFNELLNTNDEFLNSQDVVSEFGRPIVKYSFSGTIHHRDASHGGVFENIEKTFKTKKMMTDLLLTIATNVQNGVVDARDMGQIIEKKFMEEGQKFIDDTKEKINAPQELVKVKTLKPSEQNAKDLVNTLYSFANQDKGDRFNSITIDPKTKTLIATDKHIALLVKNPKGFEFGNDIKDGARTLAINPKQISNMKKTKDAKILLNASNTDKGLGYENQSIAPLLTDMYDKNKTQKTIQFTEDFRDKLASLKDFTNAQVIFAQSATDKTQFDVYHRFGESDGRQKVKIGEVALGQGGDNFADEFAIRVDQLKQVLPVMLKMYIPSKPTDIVSFDGHDANTQGLVFPVSVRK